MNKNKNIKPFSQGELGIVIARLIATEQAMKHPERFALHQGLLLDSPVKTAETVKHEWPKGKLVPGQRFQYTKVQGRSAGRTFWYIVDSKGQAHKDPAQFAARK